jgi:hypothetical protein
VSTLLSWRLFDIASTVDTFSRRACYLSACDSLSSSVEQIAMELSFLKSKLHVLPHLGLDVSHYARIRLIVSFVGFRTPLLALSDHPDKI